MLSKLSIPGTNSKRKLKAEKAIKNTLSLNIHDKFAKKTKLINAINANVYSNAKMHLRQHFTYAHTHYEMQIFHPVTQNMYDLWLVVKCYSLDSYFGRIGLYSEISRFTKDLGHVQAHTRGLQIYRRSFGHKIIL